MPCELALLFSLSIQKYSQASQSSVVWTPNVISSSCMSAEWLGYTPFIAIPHPPGAPSLAKKECWFHDLVVSDEIKSSHS